MNAAGERVEPFAGPVAILVDAMSGSASECFTGGMQSIGRARVFGQTSMGQALPALFDKLPNGDVLIHAYGDFVTADGTRLEGRGVVPDEVVPLDRARRCSAGTTRPLEAALAWIDAVGRSRSDPKSVREPTCGYIGCARRARLLDSPSPTQAVFSSHIYTEISGGVEWSSAGCVSVTYWTTTVRASDA